MTTRILFVDDEQSILDGLRNLMRKNRKKWDMVFVASGQEGLAELRKQPFRVVVSDMRMPGMDGATFLAKVRDEFPQAARLILSGHADRESVMRCVPVAHQFLSKPCDPDALQRVIERVCVLQDATEPECLRALVTSLERVPTPPALFFDISKKLADPDCSLDEVGALVQQDPAMSAKLLQLVNSAYFGVGQPVTSVKRAVAYLGAETLRSLVVAQHVASSLEHARLPAAVRRAFDSIQHSSLAVARLAQAIVGAGPLSSEAFTVGLLHDLGRLVAATAWPQDFEKVLNRTSGDVFTAEREVFGFTHTAVGAHLLGLWGLPASIVEAVAAHHEPALVDGATFGLAGAVHVASALMSEFDDSCEDTGLDRSYLERVGVAARLPEWRALAVNIAGAAQAA